MGRSHELGPTPQEHEYGAPVPLWTKSELEKALANLLPIYEASPNDDYSEALLTKDILLHGITFEARLVARNPVNFLSRHTHAPLPQTDVHMRLRSKAPPIMFQPPPVEFFVDFHGEHANVEQYYTTTLEDHREASARTYSWLGIITTDEDGDIEEWGALVEGEILETALIPDPEILSTMTITFMDPRHT